jgi:hypothetical protein
VPSTPSSILNTSHMRLRPNGQSRAALRGVYVVHIIHSQNSWNITSDTHDGLRSDSERNRAVAVTWARPPGSDAGRELSVHILLRD